MILAVLAHRHGGPDGWVLGALLVLAIVYFGWHRGRRRASSPYALSIAQRLRGELRDLRIGPLTLLPLALLVAVVLVLLLAH